MNNKPDQASEGRIPAITARLEKAEVCLCGECNGDGFDMFPCTAEASRADLLRSLEQRQQEIEQMRDRPVPPTIAMDDEFREIYCQGYRHALDDVLSKHQKG